MMHVRSYIPDDRAFVLRLAHRLAIGRQPYRDLEGWLTAVEKSIIDPFNRCWKHRSTKFLSPFWFSCGRLLPNTIKYRLRAAEKKMIIYFSHSTSVDNIRSHLSGWSNPDLSERGLNESEKLGIVARNLQIDKVYSSDLKRACDTAQIAFPFHEIAVDSRLREMNYGDLNGKHVSEFIFSENYHIKNQYPNGECCLDVEQRVRAFLGEIDFFSPALKNQLIGIVAHKYVQHALEVIIKGLTWKFTLHNDWRKTGAWQPGWEYSI